MTVPDPQPRPGITPEGVVINSYRIDTDDGDGWVWMYCPVCAAAYPIALFEDPSCPNCDQPDHTDLHDHADQQGEG